MKYLGEIGKTLLIVPFAAASFWLLFQNQEFEVNLKTTDSRVFSKYTDPIRVETFYVSKFIINERCNISVSNEHYENINIVSNSAKVQLDKFYKPPLIFKSISVGGREYDENIIEALYKDRWRLIFNRSNTSKVFELRNKLEKNNWIVNIDGITEVANAYITIKKINPACNFSNQINLFHNNSTKKSEIDFEINKLNIIDRIIFGFLDANKLYIIKNNNLFNFLILLSFIYIIKIKKYYLFYFIGLIVGIYYIKPVPVFIYPIALFACYILEKIIKSKALQISLLSALYLLVIGFLKIPVYSYISYALSILGFMIFVKILIESKS